MTFMARLKQWCGLKELPPHLRHGVLGEREAKKHLKRLGMKFLTANFRTRTAAKSTWCFVTRTASCLWRSKPGPRRIGTGPRRPWTGNAGSGSPATGLDYLRKLKNPKVKVRFDIVEVLLADGAVREVRHLPNSFAMEQPYRYG